MGDNDKYHGKTSYTLSTGFDNFFVVKYEGLDERAVSLGGRVSTVCW